MNNSLVNSVDKFSSEHSPTRLTIGQYSSRQTFYYYCNFGLWILFFLSLLLRYSQQDWFSVTLLSHLLANSFYRGITQTHHFNYEALSRWALSNRKEEAVRIIEAHGSYSWSMICEVSDCLIHEFLNGVVQDANKMSPLISETERMRDASRFNNTKTRTRLLLMAVAPAFTALATNHLEFLPTSFLLFYFVFFFVYGWYLVEDWLNQKYYRRDRLVSSLHRIQLK